MTTIETTYETRNALRSVGADLIRWGPVGPFGSYGFLRAAGQRYRRQHLATLVALWQARMDCLIACDPVTGRVELTPAGRGVLVEAAVRLSGAIR